MSECGSGPSRIILSPEDLINLDKEQLIEKWKLSEKYIDFIESQLVTHASSCETEDKIKLSVLNHHPDFARRESSLLMRLTAKEQEMQDLMVQIQESKTSQTNHMVLKSSLLDPAVNLLIQQLRKELENAKSSLEETQNELSAWKFTPDSNTGKRLMAKCRLLYQENEELGRMISSGRLAKLEGDLALQRNFSEEMKKSQSELDEFLLELDEDVEGMQSTIYFLQQQLRQAREQLLSVQRENDLLREGKSAGEISPTDNHSDELIIDDGLMHNAFPSRGDSVCDVSQSEQNLTEISNSLDNQRKSDVDSINLSSVIDRCAVYSLEKYEEISKKLSTPKIERGESMRNESFDLCPALDNVVVSTDNVDQEPRDDESDMPNLSLASSTQNTDKEDSSETAGVVDEKVIKPHIQSEQNDTVTMKENEELDDSDLKVKTEKIEEDSCKGHKRTASQVKEASGSSTSSPSEPQTTSGFPDPEDFSTQSYQTALKSKRRCSSAEDDEKDQ